ncbi:SDR family oxidoreductase [Aliikangiella sp. IMCC44653]
MSNSVKTILITGASSGFGEASAKLFAANGWHVIATARREDRLSALQQSLGESHCTTFSLDVTQPKQIDQLVDWLKQKSLSVDVLLNNAGLALGLDSADKADLNDWQTMIDTNITGLVTMTRKVLPAMCARRSGHVINIGSIAGSYAYPGGNTYGATKAFVAQFSLNLRADLAGTGVRVTNIEPGLAESEFSIVRFHGDKEKANSVYQGVEPLTPEDIAQSVYWCATQPAHVNINRIELMPTCQSFAPLTITKD